MQASEALKPVAVFAVLILVIVGGTAAVASLSGQDGPGPTTPNAGQHIEGQAPRQYQPDAMIAETDTEAGNLTIENSVESTDILIDTRHNNRYDEYDLEPVVETLVDHGHDVDVTNINESESEGTGSFGQEGYSNGTLQRYDAYLSISPADTYTQREARALESFAEGGGRVVLLGEPTQFAGGSLSGASSLRRAGDVLAGTFGVRIGDDTLYNLADDANDNNYESIYAEPTTDDALTEGVDRVQFDTAGYVSVTELSEADVVIESVEGTKTMTRGRTGQYPIVARDDNFVLVADASFLERSELYDVDNEQFVSNLLSFLVGGDKDPEVPPTPTPTPTPGEDGGFGDNGP